MPSTHRLRKLFDGLTDSTPGLRWSPDGEWLAGVLKIGETQPQLWLIDPKTGRGAVLARRPDLGSATWVDGRTIAVVAGATGQYLPRDARPGIYVVHLPNPGNVPLAPIHG
jgi:hypothetical protein